MYEGYGPGGVAVLCDSLTNNRNRTSQDLRAIFRKSGGSLAEPGAVAWQFDRKGVILVEESAAAEDDVMSAALDGGAEDVRSSEGKLEVVTEAPVFEAVKETLAAAGIAWLSAEVTMLPQNTVPVGTDDARQILRLMESLEDHDDVQAVYANFDIPDAVLAEVG
jgi:YebC/PmpR family DNA-binding regulatory protein